MPTTGFLRVLSAVARSAKAEGGPGAPTFTADTLVGLGSIPREDHNEVP